MKVWEGKQVVGFLLTLGLLRSQLQRQNKAMYFSDPLQFSQKLYPFVVFLFCIGLVKLVGLGEFN